MASQYDDRSRGSQNWRERGYNRDDRGMMDRAGDEVRSWFGDDEASRRRERDERDRADDYDRDYRRMQSGRDTRFGRGPNDGERYSSPQGPWAASERGEAYGWRSGLGPRDYPVDEARGFGYENRSFGSDGYGSNTYGPSGGVGSRLESRPRESGERFGYYTGGTAMGRFTGRGPKGYQRSDERIKEEVCDRLADDPMVDASDIEVAVENREVTLSGFVHQREDKHRAEDLVERISGVKEVHNSLRVSRGVDQPNPGNVLGLGATGTGPTPTQGATQNNPGKR